MAIFLPGPAIAEARGSVGGTCFSRNTHGAYMRNKVKPVNPNTARQVAVRVMLEQLQAIWRDVFDSNDRQGWTDFAAATPMPNALGQQTIMSGINMYIRTNVAYMTAGGTRIDAAPPIGGMAEFPDIVIEGDTTDGLRVTGTVTPTPSTGDALLFLVSPPKPFTVNFYKGPFTVTKGNIGTFTTPFELLPAADVAIGQRYYVQMKFIESLGRPANPFIRQIDILA